MRNIVLPIKNEFVEKILNGDKKYEFRKKRCKEEIKKIYIYETAPKKKIVGEVEVKEIIEGTPDEIWNKCSQKGGIDRERYNDYFKNSKIAFAYALGRCIRYSQSKELNEFGINSVPQFFVYVE